MKWTQRNITDWATETFDVTDPLTVAERMNEEVGELLDALRFDSLKEAQNECADVGVMLLQIAELLEIDLLEAVDKKMEINSNRQWHKRPDGTYQHT